MVERLTRLDASFLYLEEPDNPMHVGGVLVLERPPGGVEALAALVAARLPLVPRYRQRAAEVPGHLADPVWVDDRTSTSTTTCSAPACRGRAPKRSCSTSSRA